MMIKKIHLRDYRNISSIDFNLHPKLNIIIGENGAGKTNILESMIVVSNTKSFRTIDDRDLIMKTKDATLIDIVGDNDYRVVVSNQGKKLFINKKAILKTSNFIGKLNCILFKPSDLELFSQSSKERRKIFDIEIGKIDNQYLKSLLAYTKLLKDKNHLLKQNNIDENYLEIVEESMVSNIYLIEKRRQIFIDYINSCIEKIYFDLSNRNDKIMIIYKKSFDIDEDLIKESIKKNRDKDLLYRYTLLGPHRDDIIFKFNDYPIQTIASQGQKRLVMISFKLALASFVENVTNKKPIILLDDILSELDIYNRQRLLEKIKNIGQTVITTTDILGLKNISDGQIIKIKKGALYGIDKC